MSGERPSLRPKCRSLKGIRIVGTGKYVPDIVVDNLPHATFKGSDAQLDAAIKHLQEAIAKDPRPVPEPPAYPDKSFRYP